MPAMTEHKMGVTRACGLIGISRSLYRYRSRRVGDDEVRRRMQEAAVEKRRYGYQHIHVVLRREGWLINHKRTLRLYREAGLAVLGRKRKRIACAERRPQPKPTVADVTWSMDYVSDALADGRRIRWLHIVDDYTREYLAMEVDTSLSRRRVAKVLERLRDLRGLPLSVTVDNGPGFGGKVLDEWAYGAVCISPSSVLANLLKMPMSKASMASSGMNA
jgi:putative transposase